MLERAGFEVRDVRGLRDHYALTCRAWVTNLEDRWEEAIRLVPPARARVWRLYLAGSSLAFEGRRVGVNRVLATKEDAPPRTRTPGRYGARTGTPPAHLTPDRRPVHVRCR
jgi:cyclopropane-fatty-acyl-phospholipid synthase